MHEAAGRASVVDVPLIQVVPGSRAAGPARTVRCGQDDNLMVHAAVAEAEPGEVLVLTMPEPRPVALVGELLATQAKVAGVAAMLVDAAVRDLEELREVGLPIWARYVRVTRSGEARSGRDRRAGRGRGRDASARVTSSCSTRTGRSSSSGSGSRRCWQRPAIARSASATSARSSRRASCRTTSTASEHLVEQ